MIYGVLAGGRSRRMGCDKAFLQFDGKYVLELLLERFGQAGRFAVGPGFEGGGRRLSPGKSACGPDGRPRPVASGVCLSSARGDVGQRLIHLPEPPQEIADVVPDAGPAGGIYSLLKALQEDIFVVATDMPFADVRLARCLMALGGVADAGAVPPQLVVLEREDGRREMLFGYYGLGCLCALEDMLREGDYRLRNLSERVDCAVVTQDQVMAAYGPGCEKALFNMNTPKDYEAALAMMADERPSCDCPMI